MAALRMVLDWVDRHAALFIVIGMATLAGLGLEVKHEASDIQSQRRSTIYSSCTDQNRRHERTLATVHNLIVHAERRAKRPQLLLQLRQTEAATALVIEALAPLQDCGARVRRLTR